MTTHPTVSKSLEKTLRQLREANDGFAITVWKDGSWRAWQTLDAKYAEKDADWLLTISAQAIQEELLVRRADEGRVQ